jgi:hypothetical protein
VILPDPVHQFARTSIERRSHIKTV